MEHVALGFDIHMHIDHNDININIPNNLHRHKITGNDYQEQHCKTSIYNIHYCIKKYFKYLCRLDIP